MNGLQKIYRATDKNNKQAGGSANIRDENDTVNFNPQ